MNEYDLMIKSPDDVNLACALGVEIRKMRQKCGLTLLSMADVMGWQVSKLSKIENKIGALTCLDDANAISSFCRSKGYDLPARPEVLSQVGYLSDRSEKLNELSEAIKQGAGL